MIKLVQRKVSVMEIDSKATGKLARDARIKQGISLRKMAGRMGFSSAFLSDLELGRRNWTEEHVQTFNQVLWFNDREPKPIEATVTCDKNISPKTAGALGKMVIHVAKLHKEGKLKLNSQ